MIQGCFQIKFLTKFSVMYQNFLLTHSERKPKNIYSQVKITSILSSIGNTNFFIFITNQ